MEIIEDKSHFCAEEDEVMDGCSMAETGELLPLSHSHGLWEGKGDFLVENNVHFHAGSSSPKLGFRAATEDEKSLEEDETTPVILAMANDDDRIPDEKTFPIAGFLRLANAVVDDGDEDFKKSLMELKQRWEERIGVETSRRRTTLLRPEDEPPLVKGL
ncbi:UNVERIFIED_CONTAM: hypothetical protein Sindi_0081700 [Sesamum indicum]